MHRLYAQASFLVGASRASQFPGGGSEVAFAGRSNAGKSSAINTVTGRASLARISKTPGRTRQINFFRLDDSRRLVDLPGYGYARVPDAVRRDWGALVERYLAQRDCLRGVVLIMDIRRPFTDADRQLLGWCAEARVDLLAVLTKADKLKRGPAMQALAAAREVLADHPASGDAILFSATRRTGVDDLRGRLDRWLGLQPA